MSLQMEVTFDCEALINAVNVIMAPESTAEQRTQAQQFCDEFKEKSEYCVSCGLKLAAISEPTVVRRLGLQLIEHVAKYRWSKISADEKTFMKAKIMNLISFGTKPVMEEETCIKDGIVRIVVEIAKHSWPDHWPKMLTELQALAQKGGLYAELVLLILLRLSEDVETLQLLPSHGARLRQNLNQNIPTILAIVKGLLNEHVKMYKLLKNDPKQQGKFQTYCRVIAAALATLQEYFEWISIMLLQEKNFAILDNPWRLFNESHLQLEAADCLLVALNRSRQVRPMLSQFATFATPLLLSPVQIADEMPTEKEYLFLKKRCELLCLFGQQLCSAMNRSDTATPPLNLESYLNALLSFTTHSSQYLSCQTQSVWRALFNNRKLSRNPLLLEKLPTYLLATRTNLVKVGFPSKTNSPSCDYSRLDFDTDEDFYVFLTTFREEQKRTINTACLREQKTCFQMAAECLKYQLIVSSVDSVPKNVENVDNTTCTATHSFLQWEALSFFIKLIVTNLFKNMKKKDIPVKNGIELLQQLLKFKTNDPHILACVPTNISTLFPFLNLKSSCSPQVLFRLLEIIEEFQAPATPSLKNARKYACTVIYKICRDHDAILLPHFETLFKNVKGLLFDEQLQLSLTEKSKLVEAMFFLINLLPDYKKQKSCIDVLMAPVEEFWLSEEVKSVFADPEAFITYIGADLPMTDGTESSTDLNRSKILHCVGTMVNLVRWIRCPSDLEKARAGGFVEGVMSNGKPFLRNPCTEQVLKLLDNLLLLIRTQLNLFLPDVLSKMGTTFAEALNADHPQRIMDICDPPEGKPALQQMQDFLCTLFDSCLYILGRAGPSLKLDFFTVNDLGNKILSSACVNLDNLPQNRFLPIFNVFLRPFVKSCPEEYIESCLCPVFAPLLTAFQAKLPHKWHAIDAVGHMPKMRINFKNKKLPELSDPASSKMKPWNMGVLTKEVLTFLLETCSVHEGDTIVLTDQRKAKHDETRKKRDTSRRDEHTTSAETTDVHFVSKKDPDVICTAESDDDDDEHKNNDYDENDCVCIDDGEVACTTADYDVCLPDESVEMSDDSDDVCCVTGDGADASVVIADESDGSDDACYVVSDEEDCSAATPSDGYSFKNESADTSVVCSDSDGEMAAEVPQSSLLVSKEVAEYLKYPPLSKLGTCLMRVEGIRYTLLRIVFSCLGYKAYYCHTTSTRLCWPMLKEVMNEPLTTELVTDLFAAIFYAFPKRNHDQFGMNALQQLAFHVYETLRPMHAELKEMMEQIPNVSLSYLDSFDERLMNSKTGRPDHSLFPYFQRLLAAISKVMLHPQWKPSGSGGRRQTTRKTVSERYEKSRNYDTAFPLKKSLKRSLDKTFTPSFQRPNASRPSKVAYPASKGSSKIANPASKGPFVPQRSYKKPQNAPPPFKYDNNGPPPHKKSRNAPPFSQNSYNPVRPYKRSRRGKQQRYL